MCGQHHAEKTATLPTSASLSLPTCASLPCFVAATTSHRPWHAYAHVSRPQPHVFFATPTSRQTAPQTATRDESPHDHPGRAPSSGRAPASLTCPAPSQRVAAIPHASHTPFVCPSTSHNLTHRPQPPSMRPNMFRRASPLLDAPPPSHTRPVRPSCAADQLQFLLTSDGISFYFPSILLFQLFSSFDSCNCTSLLVNLTNITTTSLRTSTPSHGARQ